MEKQNENEDHLVLQQHSRVGSTYIPTILTSSTKFKNVSYTHTCLPELIWLAILTDALGLKVASVIVDLLASVFYTSDFSSTCWFPAISCLEKATNSQKDKISSSLNDIGLREKVADSLCRFYTIYPAFPGAFLTTQNHDFDKQAFLGTFKNILAELLDVNSKLSAIMCCHALRATYRLELIIGKITKISLLEKIAEYPQSEISRAIGAEARIFTLQMVSEHVIEKGLSDWSTLFWNQGLMIEPIKIELVE